MTINPELEPFIAEIERNFTASPLSLSVQQWRMKTEERSRTARGPYYRNMETARLYIVYADERWVSILVHMPVSQKPLPCVVYMHGGGWVLGSAQSHFGITAKLASETPAVVVSVDYGRAPEHRFPRAFEDAHAAFRWTRQNAAAIGADPETIVVSGDCAGGNLAAAIAAVYRNRQGGPDGQLLFYPCLNADFTTSSYQSEADAPFLTREQMMWFWLQYCPDESVRKRPNAAPLRAQDFSGLPPTMILAAEHDPLRDEAHAYAARLMEAGSSVQWRPGRGLIHGYLHAAEICGAVRNEYRAAEVWLRNLHTTRNAVDPVGEYVHDFIGGR